MYNDQYHSDKATRYNAVCEATALILVVVTAAHMGTIFLAGFGWPFVILTCIQLFLLMRFYMCLKKYRLHKKLYRRWCSLTRQCELLQAQGDTGPQVLGRLVNEATDLEYEEPAEYDYEQAKISQARTSERFKNRIAMFKGEICTQKDS